MIRKSRLAVLLIGWWLLTPNDLFAFPWPQNISERVRAMGSASLGIEDASTALTAFNHGNSAGLAANEKINQVSLGADYGEDHYAIRPSGAGSTNTYTTDQTRLGLQRPGNEYRILQVWLQDNWVVSADVAGGLGQIKRNRNFMGSVEEGSFGIWGGGIKTAVQFDFGLALGAEFRVYRWNGKNQQETDQSEVTGQNLYGQAAATYALEPFSPGQTLVVGLSLGTDDEMPQPDISTSLMSYLFFQGPRAGDYSMRFHHVSTMEFRGYEDGELIEQGTFDLIYDTTYTVSPLRWQGEVIYSLSPAWVLGVLMDGKKRTVHCSSVTQDPDHRVLEIEECIDYPVLEQTHWSIMPVVQGKVLLTENIRLVAGIQYSTMPQGKMDLFTENFVTGHEYQSHTCALSSQAGAAGLGIQLVPQRLCLGLHYEMSEDQTEQIRFSEDRSVMSKENTSSSLKEVRAGIEYEIISGLALRMGYAYGRESLPKGTTDEYSNTVEQITTQRITGGTGINLGGPWQVDLTVGLDTVDQQLVPDADVEHRRWDIALLGTFLL